MGGLTTPDCEPLLLTLVLEAAREKLGGDLGLVMRRPRKSNSGGSRGMLARALRLRKRDWERVLLARRRAWAASGSCEGLGVELSKRGERGRGGGRGGGLNEQCSGGC